MNSAQSKMRTNGMFLRSFDSKRYQELQLQKQQILQKQKELEKIKEKRSKRRKPNIDGKIDEEPDPDEGADSSASSSKSHSSNSLKQMAEGADTAEEMPKDVPANTTVILNKSDSSEPISGVNISVSVEVHKSASSSSNIALEAELEPVNEDSKSPVYENAIPVNEDPKSESIEEDQTSNDDVKDVDSVISMTKSHDLCEAVTSDSSKINNKIVKKTVVAVTPKSIHCTETDIAAETPKTSVATSAIETSVASVTPNKETTVAIVTPKTAVTPTNNVIVASKPVVAIPKPVTDRTQDAVKDKVIKPIGITINVIKPNNALKEQSVKDLSPPKNASDKKVTKEYAIIAKINKQAIMRETELVEKETEAQSRKAEIGAIVPDKDVKKDILHSGKLLKVEKKAKPKATSDTDETVAGAKANTQAYAVVDLEKTLSYVKRLDKEKEKGNAKDLDKVKDKGKVSDKGKDGSVDDSASAILAKANKLSEKAQQIQELREQIYAKKYGRMSRSAGYNGDMDTSCSSLEPDIDSAVDKFLAHKLSNSVDDRLIITDEQLSSMHYVGSSSSG